MARVINGDGDVDGFGDQPLSDFTAINARARAASIRQRANTSLTAGLAARGRTTAGGDRRHGWGVERQYVHALRGVSKLLTRAGLIIGDPMQWVQLPDIPTPTRELALNSSELNDYLRTIVSHSRDPLLDVACWLALRLTAARISELLRLRRPDLALSRPSLVLDGKAVKPREMPVARPVLELLRYLDRDRPESSRPAPLLRTQQGVPITARRVETWSQRLHREHEWAAGHNLRAHTLRHTTARAVEMKVGQDSLDATLFLGHSINNRHGVTSRYITPSDPDEVWARRCRTAEAVFGPLDAWPRLPENEVLRALPEMKEWMT
jgi:integrase